MAAAWHAQHLIAMQKPALTVHVDAAARCGPRAVERKSEAARE